jgi:hypothetical protein
MIRGRRPLRDHVATVSGYLNHYKSETESESQGRNSQYFTNYLLSTCWEKVTRKFKSWQAKGFLFLSQSINPDVLEKYVAQMNDDPLTVGPGDRTLARFLKSLRAEEKMGLIFDHLLDYDKDFTEELETRRHDPRDSDLLPLIFAIVKNSESDSLEPIFSKTTALEFHKLTIAAFYGFAFIFMQIEATNQELAQVSIDY